MANVPVSLKRLMEHFAALPGVGRKSAQRLAFFVLDMPQEQEEHCAATIIQAQKPNHK